MSGHESLDVDERDTGNLVRAVGFPAFLDFVVVPTGAGGGRGGGKDACSSRGPHFVLMGLLI